MTELNTKYQTCAKRYDVYVVHRCAAAGNCVMFVEPTMTNLQGVCGASTILEHGGHRLCAKCLRENLSFVFGAVASAGYESRLGDSRWTANSSWAEA